jgi:hypothetical protein
MTACARNLRSPAWSHCDEQTLLRVWRTHTPREAACVVGRSEAAARAKARRLGAAPPRQKRTPGALAELRRLHELGLSDGEAGRRLGLCPSTVARWRKALGLPANFAQGDAKAAVAVLTRRAREMGFKNHGCWLLSRRRLKRLAEWPGCTTAGQVRLCRLLHEKGPMTLKEAIRSKVAAESCVRKAARQLVELGYVHDEEGKLTLRAGVRPGEADE